MVRTMGNHLVAFMGETSSCENPTKPHRVIHQVYARFRTACMLMSSAGTTHDVTFRASVERPLPRGRPAGGGVQHVVSRVLRRRDDGLPSRERPALRRDDGRGV